MDTREYKIEGAEMKPTGKRTNTTGYTPTGYEPNPHKRESEREQEKNEQPLNPFGTAADTKE